MNYKKYDSDRSIRHKRQSLRLPKHDYSWTGAYFVTMRVKEPEPLFDIPELRKILTETWQALPKRFPGITLDEYVVMPDHIHVIVWLDGSVEKAPALGDVVGAYKSLVVNTWLYHIKATGMNRQASFWQDNYYEVCLYKEDQLEQTREYIRNNPKKLKESVTKSEK